MSSLEAINSVDHLRRHLSGHPQAVPDLLRLVNYLVYMGDQMEGVPSRHFLLKEAQCWESEELPGDAREFIAKRIFAFWKKGTLPLLKENLSCCQDFSACLPPDAAIAFLDFQKLPDAIRAEIDRFFLEQRMRAEEREEKEEEDEGTPVGKEFSKLPEVEKQAWEPSPPPHDPEALPGASPEAEQERFRDEEERRSDEIQASFEAEDVLSPEEASSFAKEALASEIATSPEELPWMEEKAAIPEIVPSSGETKGKVDSRPLPIKAEVPKPVERKPLPAPPRQEKKEEKKEKGSFLSKISELVRPKATPISPASPPSKAPDTSIKRKTSPVVPKSPKGPPSRPTAKKASVRIPRSQEMPKEDAFETFLDSNSEKMKQAKAQEEESAANIRKMEIEFIDKFGIPLLPMGEDEFLSEYMAQTKDELGRHYAMLQEHPILAIDLKDQADVIIPQLSQLSHRHLPRILKGVMTRYLYTTKEKFPLMRLKDAFLKYEKLLTTPAALLVFINYGARATDSLVRKFSGLSSLPELNEAIYGYLSFGIEQQINEHIKNFRSAIERCPSRSDLFRCIAQYPLYDEAVLKKYPPLQIIQQLKAVCSEYDEEMKDVTKLLNRHLGTGEANMKRFLQNILENKEKHTKIREDLDYVNDINTLFKHINDLRKTPEMKGTADLLFQMVVTFLRSKRQISYQTFKTSLNFLSPALQQRVIGVVRRKLTKDLQVRVQTVLSGKGKSEKRWKKLMDILQDQQFPSDAKIFGYRLSDFLYKIQSVSRRDDLERAFKMTFTEGVVPNSLKELMAMRNEEEADKGKKNANNCYRDLVDLCEAFEAGKVLSLKRPLGDLFQFYGQIEVGHEGGRVSGYEVSRAIAIYYHTPGRVRLQLPLQLDPRMSELITRMLQKEKERQQSKEQGSKR